MKTKFYPLILCVLLLTVSSMFCSAKTPEDIAKDIAPLLSENTVCVVHFDLTTLEPEQFVQSAKTLCDTIRSAAAFDEQLAKEMNAKLPPDAFLEKASQEFPNALEFIRGKCGVAEFYYLVTFPFQTCIVVPIREGVKPEFFDEKAFVRYKDFMLLPNQHLFRADSIQQEQVNRMFGSGFVATQRPELLEGLKLAGDRPVRAVAFLPTYAKPLLTQMTPQLPEPFDTIEPKQMIDALQLLVAGFDPNTMQATVIVKSKDQNAAESFRELLFSLPDKMTQLVQSQPQWEEIGIPAVILGNVLKQNADFLLPSPQDGKITIRLPGDAFAANLAKLLESIITETKTGKLSFAHQSGNCMNNLKMIVLAIHTYYDAMKCMPAAFTTDDEGKPLHSWRVTLLPFLSAYTNSPGQRADEENLYKQIRLDEPWDSEWNRQFHTQCPKVLQCPTMSDEEKAAGLTSYSVVLGRDTYPLPGRRAFTFPLILDGMSNTICVLERQTPINWMCPDQEITQEEAFRGLTDPASGLGLRHESNGKKGLNAGFFDGAQYFIGEDIAPDIWKALLTRAGGESIGFMNIPGNESTNP